MKKIILFCAIAATIALHGCVPSTRMMVNVTNAKGKPIPAQVFIDNQLIGNAPASKRESNGVWNEPTIRVISEGYAPYNGSADKEVKVANVILGLFNWFAFLWCYGPKNQQYVILHEE